MDRIDFAIIIVLYNPSEEDINYIKGLSSKYSGVVVDNSNKRTFSDFSVNKMDYIYNKGNLGIAKAQNIGLELLLRNVDFQYFVFLDQDSRVDILFPKDLVRKYKLIKEKVQNLAFLGPTVINKTNGIKYKSIFHKDKYYFKDFILRREIISSGCCVSRSVLDSVGLSEANLFIDYVDCEWCWRANNRGYVCGVLPDLSINHRVGRQDIYLWKYEIIVSAPRRYYYQYRNYLWLLRRPYVPTQWKIAMGIKSFLRFIYFPIIIKDGFECWKYMAKGFGDGIRSIKK